MESSHVEDTVRIPWIVHLFQIRPLHRTIGVFQSSLQVLQIAYDQALKCFGLP